MCRNPKQKSRKPTATTTATNSTTNLLGLGRNTHTLGVHRNPVLALFADLPTPAEVCERFCPDHSLDTASITIHQIRSAFKRSDIFHRSPHSFARRSDGIDQEDGGTAGIAAVASTDDPLGMVAPSILPQVGYRDQNTTANPPRRQTFRGDKVVQPTLANR